MPSNGQRQIAYSMAAAVSDIHPTSMYNLLACSVEALSHVRCPLDTIRRTHAARPWEREGEGGAKRFMMIT